MSYIGNTPAENYASFLTETFSVSATANYTLSHAVSNENDIRLVINNVVQQPGSGKAYTASGTTLTLTSATSSGDVMYAVYLGRALQTVNPPNASVGTAQLADSSVTSAKLASGAVANTPYFYGELASNQTLTRASNVKIAGMTNDELDSNTAFDGTTFTVPSGQAGKYFIQGVVTANYADIGEDGEKTMARLFLNGSVIKSGVVQQGGTQNMREVTCTANALLNLSAGNTIELYGFIQDASGGNGYAMANQTSLMGYKIIE